jgi:SRSO17 transposase
VAGDRDAVHACLGIIDCVMMDLVAGELDRVHERIAGRFGRAEPRTRVREYVSGLVAGLERKNGWTLAEWPGAVRPDGMQRLLRRADWDVDGVRDDVRDYVIEQPGEPGGVLIADDTGFLKRDPLGPVQRQYSGTAGRTENCPVGVLLADASVHRHALIDRELYLPQSWADDRDRCRAVGIPEGRGVRDQAAAGPGSSSVAMSPAPGARSGLGRPVG